MSALDALELARQDVGASAFDEAGQVVVQAFDARKNLPGSAATIFRDGFEGSVAGWSAAWSGVEVVELDSTDSYSGGDSLKLTTPAGESGMVSRFDVLPLTQDPVDLTVWAKGPAGLQLTLCVYEYGGSSPDGFVPQRADVPATGDWQRIEVKAARLTAPDRTGAGIYMGTTVGLPVGEQINFDDVLAVEGDPAPLEPLAIDPAVVLYSPAWSQTLDVANRIVLGYGYGAGSVTVDDPVSQSRFGVRMTGLFDSGLADQATAQSRALAWLERVAYPRWKLPGLTLLEPHDLKIGQMLELSELPASAPFPSWSPVVEGWTDLFEGPDWTQTVILSDPVLSGLGLAWQDVPPELAWAEVDPACLWRDAYLLANLTPGRTASHA
jgi:hypothetical protein